MPTSSFLQRFIAPSQTPAFPLESIVVVEPTSSVPTRRLEGMLVEDVPDELVYAICEYLSASEVCRLASTCRRLRFICSSDALWARRLRDSIPTWGYVSSKTMPGHHNMAFSQQTTWLSCSPDGPRARLHDAALAAEASFWHFGGHNPAKRLHAMLGPSFPFSRAVLRVCNHNPKVIFFGPGLQSNGGRGLIGSIMWSTGTPFKLKMPVADAVLNSNGGLEMELDRLDLTRTGEKNSLAKRNAFTMVAMYGRERTHLLQLGKREPGQWARTITADARGRQRLAATDALVFVIDAAELADCVPVANAEEGSNASTSSNLAAARMLADHRAELAEFLNHSKEGVPLLVLACSSRTDSHYADTRAPPTASQASPPTTKLANTASAFAIARMLRLGALSRDWRVEMLDLPKHESRHDLCRCFMQKKTSLPLQRGVGWLLDSQVVLEHGR